MKRFFLLALVATLCLPVLAEVDGGGMAGAYLQVNWSARVAAMGGAFVGVADDAEGGLHNPAGVIQLSKKHVTASYRQMQLDRKMSFVSYAQSLKDNDAGIGLSWINVGVSNIEQRDINGEIPGDINYSENLIALTFGKRFFRQLLVGVNLKYDYVNLADLSSNGLGFDFGLLWGEKRPYKIGFTVQNVGLTHDWATGDFYKNQGYSGSSTKDKFPIAVKAGGSYRFYQNKVLLALDLEKREKQQLLVHAGGEGWINQYLAVRAGYNRDFVTLGAGVRYSWSKTTVSFNYAFNAGQVDLDPENLISVAVEF